MWTLTSRILSVEVHIAEICQGTKKKEPYLGPEILRSTVGMMWLSAERMKYHHGKGQLI